MSSEALNIDRPKKKKDDDERTDCARARAHTHRLVIESCVQTPSSRKNRFLMSMCSRATRNYINTRETATTSLVVLVFYRLARASTIERMRVH